MLTQKRISSTDAKKSPIQSRTFFLFALLVAVLVADPALALPSKNSSTSRRRGAFSPIGGTETRPQPSRKQALSSSASRCGNQELIQTKETPNDVAAQQKQSEKSKMSRIREAIFPIYGKEEVTKFLFLGSIKFFIVLALVLSRDTKDTLIVTQCGAEAISFLKVRKQTCEISRVYLWF